MSALVAPLRSLNVASSSRSYLNRSTNSSRWTSTVLLRCLSTSHRRFDIQAEIEKQLNPREIIERKRKEFEEKYGDKLKQKVEAEGVKNLDELKKKVKTPSIEAALKAKRRAEEYQAELKASKELAEAQDRKVKEVPSWKERAQSGSDQASGDRAGVKPLSSIINLPLIHLTPHDSEAISKIWTTYHTTHPTLSSSFLSASLPTSTYKSMIKLARENPFFVLPLPRAAGTSSEPNNVKTDEYEMYYLQWLFHPTPSSTSPPNENGKIETLPYTSSAIFTPLEEFKKQGEWAQPYLVLTHYPDLSITHNTVLMRGEISPTSASGPTGSDLNPGFLLSQQEAQLLALALQRFYCADLAISGESKKSWEDRKKRIEALRGFRENPQDWDWSDLVSMAYGGLV